MERPANLVDLNAMAEAAEIHVTVQIEEDGNKRTKSLKPKKNETDESGVPRWSIVVTRRQWYNQVRKRI